MKYDEDFSKRSLNTVLTVCYTQRFKFDQTHIVIRNGLTHIIVIYTYINLISQLINISLCTCYTILTQTVISPDTYIHKIKVMFLFIGV